MNRKQSLQAWLVRPLFLGFVLSLSQGVEAAPRSDPDESTADCGTLSLYQLLRLEGHPIVLAEIAARLPAPARTGYSMKELRDAASESGVSLDGIRLVDPTNELDRPMIVFLKRGHFVVIRPVGQTGKLAQVLNGVEPPAVVEKKLLNASSDWTGLALAPRRAHWPRGSLIFLLCLTGLALIRELLLKRRIPRRI